MTCELFEALGWAPVRNDAHDLGTDLWVEVADRRLFMRGLIIGVQVKSGPSWFRREQHTPDGELQGWWYYEPNNKHFDHWFSHGVPHLIVLCNLAKRVAYWAHVTPGAVESVGKGSKIFVPAGQTIADDCFDSLLATAATQRAAPPLEGTALWTGEGAVAQSRKLRCGLIAPRLLAPHPNAGQDEAIDAFAGVALAAQGRFRDLKRFSEHHLSVPDLENPGQGCDWVWQLMAAIWQWESTGSTEPLCSVFESAPDAGCGAASGVLLACALGRVEQPEAALVILDKLIEGDELQPVDYGWVLVQRSRVRAEIGDIAGARADASAALRDFAASPDDVSVSPLAAAAAWQLFMTAPRSQAALRDFAASADDVSVSPLAAAAAWQLFMTARRSQPVPAVTEKDEAEDVGDPADAHRVFVEMIAASDTAVSWWRSQMIAAALYQAEVPAFERWAEVSSVRVFPTGDPWSAELFAAELSTDVTADQSRWRDISALRARQRLVRAPECDDETAELVEGLGALRRSGHYQSLSRAVGHLHQVGPLEAVADAVSKVPLDGWTHTSACTNFEMLAHAGDLLDEPVASQLIASSLDLASGYPADFVRRVRPDFNVRLYALQAVRGLLAAASPEAHCDTVQFITEQTQDPQEVKLGLRGAVGFLDFEQLPDPEREALWRFARQDQDLLGAEVLAWLASNGDTQAPSEIARRATNGDRYALENIGDLTRLDNSDAARLLIESFEARTRGVVGHSRSGAYTGEQYGAQLAHLNLRFPDEARWDPVIELLLEPMVAAGDKRNVCSLIVGLPQPLPQQVCTALAENIEKVAAARPGLPFDADVGGARVALAIAVGALDGADSDTAAAALACGSHREREDVAHLLGSGYCPHQQPILAALINDQHAPVRKRTAHAIGRLANTSPTKPTSQLARTIADSDGTLMVTWLLLGLSIRDAPLSEMGTEIAQQLSQHHSGRVRQLAARTLR